MTRQHIVTCILANNVKLNMAEIEVRDEEDFEIDEEGDRVYFCVISADICFIYLTFDKITMIHFWR